MTGDPTSGASASDSPASDSTAAWDIAARVLDPELPVLSLAELGVLRDVEVLDTPRGPSVTVTLTPTYSGCPAMATMQDDLRVALRQAGYADVEIRIQLQPAWSTEWISGEGRRKLLEAGIAPPGPVPPAPAGPIPLTLMAPASQVECPQCGSPRTQETSHFGSTACMALYRCTVCAEPFPHVKAL